MSRTINRTLMSLSAALGVALAMATTAQAAVGTSHPGRFAGYTESANFPTTAGAYIALVSV